MPSGPPRLTTRQRQVLHLVAAGCSTKQVASRLRIGERTAQWHISRLMDQFDVTSRAALVLSASLAGHVRRIPMLHRNLGRGSNRTS